MPMHLHPGLLSSNVDGLEEQFSKALVQVPLNSAGQVAEAGFLSDLGYQPPGVGSARDGATAVFWRGF